MPSMDFAYDLIDKLSEEADVDYARKKVKRL